MGAHTTLILGGARSGKTARALKLCEGFENKIYVATAHAGDEEMAQRIAAHQVERGTQWSTVEAPIDLPDRLTALQENAPSGPNATSRSVVVDCLTLWLSNLMLAGHDVDAHSNALITAVKSFTEPLVIITNEVGLGVVPDTKLGRQFRDAQGLLNQRVATNATVVEFVAAGLPMRLKP